MATVAPLTPSVDRLGVNIQMGTGPVPVVSNTWTIGPWSIRFVRLTAQQQFIPDRSYGPAFVKVITGRLSNLGLTAYPEVGEVRSTALYAGGVEAGPEGALFAIFAAVGDISAPISSIDQLLYRGPLADSFTWRSFESMYTASTPIFDGVDAHLAPGFHLLDVDGTEIAYVFTWAAGKGVDMTTHNHGRSPKQIAPAFAEVHWVMHNGTGLGGMYVTDAPDSLNRDHTVVQQGEEHGPFFAFDATNGAPRLRANGAVEYPWHGWQAGDDNWPGQAYDVVVAFEITAPYARVIDSKGAPRRHRELTASAR
jgi:hypothetical protein